MKNKKIKNKKGKKLKPISDYQRIRINLSDFHFSFFADFLESAVSKEFNFELVIFLLG